MRFPSRKTRRRAFSRLEKNPRDRFSPNSLRGCKMSRPSRCRLFERASSNTFRVIHEKPPARGPGFHPVRRIPALLDTGCQPVDWLVYQASALAVATRHSVHEWLSGDRGLLTFAWIAVESTVAGCRGSGSLSWLSCALASTPARGRWTGSCTVESTGALGSSRPGHGARRTGEKNTGKNGRVHKPRASPTEG